MLTLYSAYDIQSEFKIWIKHTRKQQKLTVEALAQKSGVPYSTIRKFENTGNISFRQWLMLCEALGQLPQIRHLMQTPDNPPASISEVLNHA